MASIARKTFLNLLECIRCFFLCGIETSTNVPCRLLLEPKRYSHIKVEDMSSNPKDDTIQNQTWATFITPQQQEPLKISGVAFVMASINSPTDNIFLKSSYPTMKRGLTIDFAAQSLNHIVPDDKCYEVCDYSNDKLTPSYFASRDKSCNTPANKHCSRETLEVDEMESKESNSLKVASFADGILTRNFDDSDVELSRERTFSESSDDNFICFIQDDLDCKCSLSSSRNYGYYSNQYDSDEEILSSTDVSSCDGDEDCILPTEKKVRFDLKPKVHVMYTWDFAYRNARRGNWENVARDRVRFHNRIQRAAEYLDPILDPIHRQKIYESLYLNANH